MSKDFGIDKLFRAYKEVELPNGTVLRVRALSDLEIRTIDQRALALSAEYREKLDRQDSDEYRALVYDSGKWDEDAIIDMLEPYYRLQFVEEAARKIPYEYIPFPENASEEQRREILAKRQKSEEEIRKKRDKFVEDSLKRKINKLRKLAHDQFVAETLKDIKEMAARLEYSTYRTLLILLAACEKEDGERYFSNLEEVMSVPERIRNELFLAYNEVSAIDVWELEKNSSTDTSQEPTG